MNAKNIELQRRNFLKAGGLLLLSNSLFGNTLNEKIIQNFINETNTTTFKANEKKHDTHLSKNEKTVIQYLNIDPEDYINIKEFLSLYKDNDEADNKEIQLSNSIEQSYRQKVTKRENNFQRNILQIPHSPNSQKKDRLSLLYELAEASKINRKHKDKNERILYLVNTHTLEKIKVTYYKNGYYIKESLKEIEYFGRDFRQNKTHYLSIKTLDILHTLKQRLYLHKSPFYVLSWYRTPYTNKMLRKHGHHTAKHSLHMVGKAVDITVYNRKTSIVAQEARRLKLGGVGEYRRNYFVHIDSGRVRNWYG